MLEKVKIMNNFIENFLKIHPKLNHFIELTCAVWSNMESAKYTIIQSPKDASTCLMCVQFADVVCPFAFCNAFTSWAFVSIKRIKEFPMNRFRCCNCKNKLEKYQYCKECKERRKSICQRCAENHLHQVELIDNFEYYGCIPSNQSKSNNINELLDCAERGVYFGSNKKPETNIDPLIHRESNTPWDTSFMPLLSSPAAA